MNEASKLKVTQHVREFADDPLEALYQTCKSVDSFARQLGSTSTALRSMSRLLHRHHTDDALQLNDDEVEGLYLSIEAISGYILHLQASLEDVAHNEGGRS